MDAMQRRADETHSAPKYEIKENSLANTYEIIPNLTSEDLERRKQEFLQQLRDYYSNISGISKQQVDYILKSIEHALSSVDLDYYKEFYSKIRFSTSDFPPNDTKRFEEAKQVIDIIIFSTAYTSHLLTGEPSKFNKYLLKGFLLSGIHFFSPPVADLIYDRTISKIAKHKVHDNTKKFLGKVEYIKIVKRGESQVLIDNKRGKQLVEISLDRPLNTPLGKIDLFNTIAHETMHAYGLVFAEDTYGEMITSLLHKFLLPMNLSKDNLTDKTYVVGQRTPQMLPMNKVQDEYIVNYFASFVFYHSFKSSGLSTEKFMKKFLDTVRKYIFSNSIAFTLDSSDNFKDYLLKLHISYLRAKLKYVEQQSHILENKLKGIPISRRDESMLRKYRANQYRAKLDLINAFRELKGIFPEDLENIEGSYNKYLKDLVKSIMDNPALSENLTLSFLYQNLLLLGLMIEVSAAIMKEMGVREEEIEDFREGVSKAILEDLKEIKEAVNEGIKFEELESNFDNIVSFDNVRKFFEEHWKEHKDSYSIPSEKQIAYFKDIPFNYA